MENWQILAASKAITMHTSQSRNPANPVYEYNPHRGFVNCAVFNHTNKVIASCGQDSKISLYSASSPKDKLAEIVYYSVTEEPSSVNSCLFSHKSKYIAAGSVNSTVKIWDMKNIKEREPMKKLKGHVGAVTSLAWVGQQEIIASSSTCGDVYLHDVGTGAIRQTLSSKMQEGINSIRVSEGETFRRLAACTNSGSVMVWDLNSVKKPIYIYEDAQKASITGISISAYKPALLASVSIDSMLTFSDILQRKVVKTVATEQPITSVAFHSNGQMIAVGGMNGGLSIYDLKKLSSPIIKLNGHDTPVKSVFFSEKIEKHYDRYREKQRQKASSDYYPTTENPRFVRDNQSSVGGTSKNDSVAQSKQIKSKVITPSKMQPAEDEEKRQLPKTRGLKNLSKREDPIVGPLQQQPRTAQNMMPNHKSSTNPLLTHNHHNSTPHSTSNSADPPALKNIQQKMINEHMELRMEMNERFDGLHLQIIRQMQNLLREVSQKLQASNNHTRQLQERVKRLEAENEDLRKRTY